MTKKHGAAKFIIIICLFLGAILGFFVFNWAKNLPIPDFQNFDQRKIIESTKIYDRTGQALLFDIHQNIKRTVIPYEDVPRSIKNATVAIEDSKFYQHSGVSFEGIIRAFLTNLREGKIKGQGGSTITQQLIKNALLTSEKTFTRKIQELILAIKVERVLSKDEILTLYLNEIPYGGNAYGVEAATQSFFGKSAQDLTLAESAYLAALPQAPTYYSPYGNHKDELEQRKNTVLQRMLDLGFIDENEYEEAKNSKVTFISPSDQGIRAPHFVMFIKGYLEKKYGQDVVENGGLKVITTLNLSLQEEAEKMVADYTKENEKKFDAKNAGLAGLDPKTGQILVMVGSKNYFDKEYDGEFNVTLAKRQPGSAFKPFVYATAFKKGYTPDTVVFDLKTEFNSSCNPDSTPQPGTEQEECYQPENYDSIYRGPISLRNALAQSINIPAVKVLYLAGLNDSLQTAKNLGITTLSDPLRYGLTLVLGGGEVTLLDMTSAYSVFANDGVKNPPVGILKVTDSKGGLLEEFQPKPTEILEKTAARTINSILSDNEARAPAFGEQSWLYFPDRDVAAKTGTTNDYRDAWVIGYTPNFALGVWVGNNDNSPMVKKVAGFIAAPLWNQFFKKVFETLPKENLNKETVDNEEKRELKPILRGVWQEENGQVHSILYWVDKKDPLGPDPTNPEKDPQFNLWEKPVRDWVESQKIKEETTI